MQSQQNKTKGHFKTQIYDVVVFTNIGALHTQKYRLSPAKYTLHNINVLIGTQHKTLVLGTFLVHNISMLHGTAFIYAFIP